MNWIVIFEIPVAAFSSRFDAEEAGRARRAREVALGANPADVAWRIQTKPGGEQVLVVSRRFGRLVTP